MPNCFTLTPIGEKEPKSLNAIDAEICALMGVEVHETRYCANWFDFIGYRVSKGMTFDQIIDDFRQIMTERPPRYKEFYEALIQITEYLKSKYTTNSWVEIGRRN